LVGVRVDSSQFIHNIEEPTKFLGRVNSHERGKQHKEDIATIDRDTAGKKENTMHTSKK
jgi:hypothetical protein